MTVLGRVARLLPQDGGEDRAWLDRVRQEADAEPRPLLPPVQALADFVDGTPPVRALFHQMFEEAPPAGSRADGAPDTGDWRTLLRLMSHLSRRAPEFNRTRFLGAPLNALLARPLATPAGYAAFTHPGVVAHVRAILDAWGAFLRTPESRHTLTDDPRHGWFGEDARAAMPTFERDFLCDPTAPYHGFGSWDDFFTRRLRPGARPVADPDDPDTIVSACEAAPWRIAQGVAHEDRFWIKEQPYSLRDMLAGDPLAARFVGGTVYQAYLSATNYHRWAAPVAGRVVRAHAVPGTYFAEDFAQAGDPRSPDGSQGYITAVAARGIVLIESENPALGLVGFVGVGMSEVSTCEVLVREGQQVTKGEEIGSFHYGGSSWCLLTGPQAELAFDLHGQQPKMGSSPLPVRSRLARLVR